MVLRSLPIGFLLNTERHQFTECGHDNCGGHMSKRKKIPSDIEAEVLLRSGRRCCLCYGLQRDFSTKQGQIAHIDHDPSNCSARNLVFLCLFHHDAFDSVPRQSKRITETEVLLYRDTLYAAVGHRLPRSEDYASALSMPVAASEIHTLIDEMRTGQHHAGTLLSAHEIDAAVTRSILQIAPYDARQLGPTTYTLSLGDQAIVNDARIHIDAKHPLSLAAGRVALAVTHECIGCPLNVLGRLFPLSASRRLGLIVHSVGQVHPGFLGRLFFVLENVSSRTCLLPPGTKLTDIEFTLLAVPPTSKARLLV